MVTSAGTRRTQWVFNAQAGHNLKTKRTQLQPRQGVKPVRVLIVAVGVLLLVPIVPVPVVHAASYVLDDKASCFALGGGVFVTPDICVFLSLALNRGDSLTVASGIRMGLDGKGPFNIYGSLINNGSIINFGANLFNNGSIINNGAIWNSQGKISNNGSITNFGAVYNKAAIKNHGRITNDGVWDNDCGGMTGGKRVRGIQVNSGMVCAPTFQIVSLYTFTRTPTISGTVDPAAPLTITLYNGTTAIGSTFETTGSWSITTASLAGGMDVLFATATNSSGSTSPPSEPLDVAITPATSTVVSCVPKSLQNGTATTCTATVTDIGGGTPTTPMGTVKFSSFPPGSFGSKKCALPGSVRQSSCSVTFTPFSAGTYKIKAVYQPTDDHGVSLGRTKIHVT